VISLSGIVLLIGHRQENAIMMSTSPAPNARGMSSFEADPPGLHLRVRRS